MRKKHVFALFVVALWATLAIPAMGEVRLFVTKNTVKLYDPVLNDHSVLNDFAVSGWKTHNNLAVVWDDDEVLAYDIRSHQWIPLSGVSVQMALLTDEFAIVWNKGGTAVFDSSVPQWVVAPPTQGEIKTALLSRKIALAMTDHEFMVYDSVLRNWQTAAMDNAERVFDGAVGDNLAVCWDAYDVCVYDMTMHRWEIKPIAGVQAAVVLDKELRLVTADKIYTYDAMKHRWFDKVR